MPVIGFKGNKLDPASINALATGTLVEGHVTSKWWRLQGTQFLDSFMAEIKTAMNNGESVTQAITRVTGGTVDGVVTPGILKTTKAKAGALVATAQNAVSNSAALASYQANNDVIKQTSQVSTLDNRTSDICIAYSGQVWDVMTLTPVAPSTLPFNGGPPRHFNCRSRLRPVTKSFKELGIDLDEIPAGTRASMDGQVAADITFDAWLRSKAKTFQDKLLGQKRAELWRQKQITLTQLVDMRGNPMSLAQLEQKLGLPPKVDPLKKAAPKPSEKLTPPSAEVIGGITEEEAAAQLKALKEKIKQQGTQNMNDKVALALQDGDFLQARKVILDAIDDIDDSVKANALKRIEAVEKEAQKTADKVFAKHKVGDSVNRNDFNGRVADGLLDDLEDNAPARKLFIRKARQFKEAQEEAWKVSDIRDFLDSGDSLKAKAALEGTNIAKSPKLQALAKEIDEGRAKALKIVDELTEAQANGLEDFTKLVKQKINADDVPQWVRNEVLNMQKFRNAELRAQYRPTFDAIRKMLDENKIDDAAQLFETLPPGVPGKPTLLGDIQAAKKKIDDIVKVEFPKKAREHIKELGFSSADEALLMTPLEELAILKQGIFDEATKTFLRKEIGQARIAMKTEIDKLAAINKASKGVNEITAHANTLSIGMRTHPDFQKAINKITKQAKKKALIARNEVVEQMLDNGKLTAGELSEFEEIIFGTLDDVHKKLGVKQLKSKHAQIQARVAAAKKGEDVSVSVYTKDPTDYDALVDDYLLPQGKLKLDEAVRAFADDANSASGRSALFEVLQGKSEKQVRAIREFVHKRVNPKKTPSGANFDAAVADITTMHANNVEFSKIQAKIIKYLDGQKTTNAAINFEQTVFTRAGVKNIDELGIVPEGSPTPAVTRIRQQLADHDPGNVPLPSLSAVDEMTAVKDWLNAGRQSQDDFLAQTLRSSKSMVNNGASALAEGERMFGEGIWGITKSQWDDWVKNVAPTLDEWDIALIHEYTGGMAGRINSGLYNGGLELKNTGGAQALNRALDKMPKHKGTLYRGTSERQNWNADYIDARYKVGETVIERGFGSSSVAEPAAFSGPFKFIIKTKGRNAAIVGHVGRYGSGEMEVLFKAGTKFKVVKKVRSGNSMKIWMEEV